MNHFQAAWLAGFLDGEGSFMIERATRKHCSAPFYVAVVAASNTDRRLVDRCKELAGGTIVTTKAKSARWKDAHIWQLKGIGVAAVIEAVLPFLISKKPQAELLLKLRSMTKLGSPAGRFGTRKTPAEQAERIAIYDQVQALNRRGNPEYAAMAERRIKGDAGMFAEVDHQ